MGFEWNMQTYEVLKLRKSQKDINHSCAVLLTSTSPG